MLRPSRWPLVDLGVCFFQVMEAGVGDAEALGDLGDGFIPEPAELGGALTELRRVCWV